MHMAVELWGKVRIVTVGNAGKKIGKTTSFWHVGLIDYKKYIYM